MFFRKKSKVNNTKKSENTATEILGYKKSTPPSYGSYELLDAYNKMPWLRAVVGKIGQAVGTTEWHIYRTTDQNNKARKIKNLTIASKAKRDKVYEQGFYKSGKSIYPVEEVLDHPILDLLYKGNEYFIGSVVLQITQIHLDLVGEAFWLLEKNKLGQPIGIWPLPPIWIKNLPTQDHPYYKIQFGNSSAQRDIPVTEIIKFVDPNPLNPYGRGSGISKALGDELETDEYSAKFLKTFFYNKATPDVIISAENLRKEDTERLEANWLAKHQGFFKAFKPYFINRKLDIKTIGYDMRALQMTELRKVERDIIMQVFGIPPEKLGQNSASNRSTITAADLFWTKDILMPRIENIRRTLQLQLIPLFDDTLILDFDSPIVEDKELELQIMRALPGAFTKNEWRAAANKPSIGEAGDVFILRAGEIEVPINQSSNNQQQNVNNSTLSYKEIKEKILSKLTKEQIENIEKTIGIDVFINKALQKYEGNK